MFTWRFGKKQIGRAGPIILDHSLERVRAMANRDLQELANAQKAGDGVGIYEGLCKVYGALEEVQMLTGPFQSRSILIFKNRIGVQVGTGSYISILTAGYNGQGPSVFSALLSSAGFAICDASILEPPVKLKKDGAKVQGTVGDNEVDWEDGSITKIPEDVGPP